MLTICGLICLSCVVDIVVCTSICALVVSWATAFIWRIETSGNSYVVPCCISLYMCSTTCYVHPTNFLCSLMSLVVCFVPCIRTFCTYYSTPSFWRSCLPLKSCGSSSFCSCIAPLHSTSFRSCTRIEGFKLLGLMYIKFGKTFLKANVKGWKCGPKHYLRQEGKAKRTRSIPYYSQKELLLLAYSITITQVVVKSWCKKKEKGRVYMSSRERPTILTINYFNKVKIRK